MNLLHWILLIIAGGYVLLRMSTRPTSKIPAAYFRYAVLGLSGVLFLAPFFWLLCAAFKDKDVLMQYTFLPPLGEWSRETINFDSFRRLFTPRMTPQGELSFWRHVVNSVFFASTVTIAQLFFCSLGGYALAKYDFRGRKAIIFFMLASMMIPGLLFLAPVYRLVVALGWIDSYKALIIPGAANAFGMFLFRQAILGVPNDLIEAGRIDGCNEFSIYYHLVMPLVRPMTGAFCLIVFLGTWNNFLGPQIFLQTEAQLPLPTILVQYMGVFQHEYGVFLAGTLLAIIPPAILFFALQREFISGLTSGAVKG